MGGQELANLHVCKNSVCACDLCNASSAEQRGQFTCDSVLTSKTAYTDFDMYTRGLFPRS